MAPPFGAAVSESDTKKSRVESLEDHRPNTGRRVRLSVCVFLEVVF